MTEDPNRHRQAEDRLDEPDYPESTGRTPGGLTWPIRRFFWALEKHFLWPIADSFKRITKSMRYRSPLAYIGATMLVMMTVATGAAAFYFYNEAEEGKEATIAEVPAATETIVAPTTPVPTTPVTPPSDAKPDDTLKGVVPDFDTASGESSGSSGNGSSKKAASQDPSATVVKPAETPDSPPLKVAHKFAQTFADYEIGRKGAAKDFEKTATAKLTSELKKNPPRQPSNGDIPRATVMNVVKGEKDGDTMDVSVSLLRSGATSELRLELDQANGKKWLVSEVRG
ncbi:MAG: hypothetical protein ACSLFI_12570 [Solirubrobacterales bacterium]